jgi:acyl-coenzyme A synthetase/AMP-(fatty) acid ligase
VVADVVLKTAQEVANQNDILAHCRKTLPPHKVPAMINFVPTLAVAETGKLLRHA